VFVDWHGVLSRDPFDPHVSVTHLAALYSQDLDERMNH
jgi:hypothetical protein